MRQRGIITDFTKETFDSKSSFARIGGGSLGGKARGNIGETLANYLVDNICEYRRDCVAFISPDINDTVNVPLRELDNLIEFRNSLRSTSYAVLD
jgi:hypothetical protein